MIRRSVFLSLSAGLLTSLAFSTPSQASGTLLKLIIPQAGTTITSSEPTVDLIPSAAAANIAPGRLGETVVAFPFEIRTSAGGLLEATSDAFVETGGDPARTSSSVSRSAFPEPASMSLLGIGMLGFFTYRRLFKRPSAV
jgi:hypothetical protein